MTKREESLVRWPCRVGVEGLTARPLHATVTAILAVSIKEAELMTTVFINLGLFLLVSAGAYLLVNSVRSSGADCGDDHGHGHGHH